MLRARCPRMSRAGVFLLAAPPSPACCCAAAWVFLVRGMAAASLETAAPFPPLWRPQLEVGECRFSRDRGDRQSRPVKAPAPEAPAVETLRGPAPPWVRREASERRGEAQGCLDKK